MSLAQKTDDKRIHAGFVAQAGKGRPKGTPNKATTAVKDMVIKALDKAGGVDYLVEQARENPTAFMSLVGKVIPSQHNISGNITHTHALIEARKRAGLVTIDLIEHDRG